MNQLFESTSTVTFWQEVASVLGIASVIGAFVLHAARPHIIAWIKKHLGHDKQDNRIAELEEKKEKDYEAITKLSAEMKAIMKALVVLLEHAETGNHTGEMKKVRDDLIRFIIDN